MRLYHIGASAEAWIEPEAVKYARRRIFMAGER
jgi:hypothetical protein